MGLFNNLFNKKSKTKASQESRDKEVSINTQPINLSLTKEESLKVLDLRKDKLSLCLEKRDISDLTAQIALVLDYSGSMRQLYSNGTIQRIIERILPIAMKFDDDGEMEVWLFSDSFNKIGPISLGNYYNFLYNNNILNTYPMCGTKYSPVMENIINNYIKEDVSCYPTLVLFITDGDNVGENNHMPEMLIKSSSTKPIFWQFIGIGKERFSFLESLDTMSDRIVDNANFFKLNDIDKISDEELYDRLLNEYPSWLKAAKEKNIIK